MVEVVVKNKKLVIILIAFFLVVSGFSAYAGGGGEKQTTQINFETRPARVFISPNGDGVQDTLSLSVDLVVDEDRVIKKYELAIYNDVGELVYQKSESKIGEGRGFFGDLFGVGEIPNVKIPDSLSWDGTDMDGNTVSDGDYLYQITITDNDGNVAKTPPMNVTLDTEAPKVTKIEAEYTVFSPNDDGVRDVIEVEQAVAADDATGASKVQWTGMIKDNSGTVVYSRTWAARPDSLFRWDGTGEGETVLEDGNYTYQLEGVDPAGNTSEAAQVSDIILSTKEADLALFADSKAFSPNGDGNKDTITFTTQVSDAEGVEIVDWNFRVLDKENVVMRRIEGSGRVPPQIVFDGRGSERAPKAENSKVLPEDSYQAVLAANFKNGNYEEAEPVSFSLDITPPTAFIEADPAYFGGESKQKVNITITLSEQGSWTGVVDSPYGEYTAALSELGINGTSAELAWYGYDLDGNEVPDGRYSAYIYSTDEAGNYGASTPVAVTKDTRDTPIEMNIEEAYFSPNGDGVKDSVTIDFYLAVDESEAIEEFLFYIVNDMGRTVRSRTIRTALDQFEWDGRTNANTGVPDGKYTAELEVRYKNGNNPKITGAGPIYVDKTAPDVIVEYDYKVFSPDGDGLRDTVSVIQSSSEEDLWVGEIIDSDGEVAARIQWQGTAKDFTWDGTDAQGNKLSDGIYTYRVYSVDKAGNRGGSEISGVRIDTLSREIDIAADLDGFSPNGDGFRDSIDFNLSVEKAENVDSWSLSFGDTLYGIRYTIEGEGRVPESFTWDGKGDDGRTYDGEYYAQLKVLFNNGNRAEQLTDNTFILDASPPKAELRLNPLPLSPDGDGYNEEVTIRIEASDFSEIGAWSIDILDPAGELFQSWSGSGSPIRAINWDGSGYGDKTVGSAEDYTVRLMVEDEFRNTAQKEALLPTDLLVMREGDQLKILLPNIQFAPNTADFFYFDEELGDKNIEVLQRLATALKRFGYKITVEGHAVKVFWADPEKGDIEQREVLIPLSVARAKEVKKALAVLGVARAQVDTAGRGGSDPIVPHSNYEERWINRRTEYILDER